MAHETVIPQIETPALDAWAQRAAHRRIVAILAMALSALALNACGLSQAQPGRPSLLAQNQPSTSVTPVLVGPSQYSSAPPMLIDQSKQYFATIKMANGREFVVQLYPDKAPLTVNSFVFLAQQGFFDGTSFHRVLEGFMAQGGDPTGTGTGGPGYQFDNEANDLTFGKAGVVAMANAGPNTNGSQFFITFGPTGLSERDYTIFGQVIRGMDVVNSLTRRDPQENPSYLGDIIRSISITQE